MATRHSPILIKIGLCLVAIGVLRWIDMMK